jgi:hypothetical protein
MKFWRFGKLPMTMARRRKQFSIAIVVIALTSIAALAATTAYPQPQKAHRANEPTLAGIRPGRDNISAAEKKFPATLVRYATEAPSAHIWRDRCSGRKVSLEVDDSGVVQNIDIESAESHSDTTCEATSNSAAASYSIWQTGHGLRLGDTKQRAIAMYGKPGSEGPSVKNGHALELLYYAFDWAGPDVPQVLEISCDRASGRVVEILLAFPSL